MDAFGILFGSGARVKIIRLFLLNSEDVFENAVIAKRSKVTASVVRKELALLLKAGLIRKKSFFKEIPPKTKSGKPKKKRVCGWALNGSFELLKPLRDFLINTEPMRKDEISNKFKHVGKIKLLVISGIFIQDRDSRVDLLIVGDNLKKGLIENALQAVEAEVGKEISYAYFDTQEFLYRIDICDKFVRDVVDYPHQRVINKLNF
ncbi:MAG: hypothetical protein KAS07_00155 [Candidatus Pacebacteria bacterium]|nr:hypothetical protein [Candidatus Paceibacterota bacterium]